MIGFVANRMAGSRPAWVADWLIRIGRPLDVGGRAVYTLLTLASLVTVAVSAWALLGAQLNPGPWVLFAPVLFAVTWVLLLQGRQRAGTILLFTTFVGVAIAVAAARGNLGGEPFVIIVLVLTAIGLVSGSRAAIVAGVAASAIVVAFSILFTTGAIEGRTLTLEPTAITGLLYAISVLLITMMLVIGVRGYETLLGRVRDMNQALGAELEERERMAAALAASEAELGTILAHAPIGVVTADREGRILRFDGAMAATTDRTVENLRSIVSEADLTNCRRRVAELRAGAPSVEPFEVTIDQDQPVPRVVRMHFGLAADQSEGPDDEERIVILIEDVTEQRRIERQLQSEQRHHHMGQIAGGVAHDFNNLMAAVLAQATVATERAERGLANTEQLEQVKVGARTAAVLTRQLVSYAGNAPQETERLDVAEVIETIRELFTATLPNGVDLVTDYAPGTPAVIADRSQLQQVIMNLLLNSAQAMRGRRGTVRLGTGTVELEAGASDHWHIAGHDLRSGRYACVHVTDDGSGIEREVLARMWDPFFTTEPDGHGLGLSAVRGIVRSHGGALRVETEVGVGTTIGLVLPAAP
ncbi:MAG: ATP-binding protein [Actinomycetota bacterium]